MTTNDAAEWLRGGRRIDDEADAEEFDRQLDAALATERRATLDDVRTAAHCLEVIIDDDVPAPEEELLFVPLSQLEAYLDGRRVLHRLPDGSAILDAEAER